MRILLRLTLLLFVILNIIILSAMYLSTGLPSFIGAVSGPGLNIYDNNISLVHYDLNTGILVHETTGQIQYNSQMLRVGCVTQLDDSESIYYINQTNPIRQEFELIHQQGEQETVLATYENLSIVGYCWQDENNNLNFIHSDEENGSILYEINLESGNLSAVISIPDFMTGFVQLSPDEDYLVLSNYVRHNSYQHLLIHLSSGTVSDLGQLAFTSWSPDNTSFVIGYDDEDIRGIQVSRYDVATHTTESLDINITKPNTPSSFRSDSLRWSPDGQQIALINLQRELVIINQAGEQTIFDDDIKPLQWSPDGRYLLASGFDRDLSIAAFLLDTQEESIRQIRPENDFQESRINLRWSPDSQYIALFETLDMSEPAIGITIFNTQAEIVRGELILFVPDDIILQAFNLSWMTG